MATYQIDTADGHTYEIDTQESPSKTESFARGVENNFPLANQAIAAGSAALGDKSYSQNLEEQNSAISKAKSANPLTYDAGAVAGAVAPAFLPGVGEALESAPIGANAALGAASAIGNTDLSKRPEEALKQGLEGGVLGGAIGKLLPTGSAAQEGLENFANRKTVEASRLPPGLLNRPKEEIESLGQTMHDYGIDTGHIDDKINIAAQKLKEVGSKIGTSGQGLAPLSPEHAEAAVNQLHDLIRQSNDVLGPGNNPESPLYQAAIDKLSKPGTTFEDLQKMKSALGERAFTTTGDVRNDAAANAYQVYKNTMKSMIEGSPEEYQDLMTQYGDLLDINQALGKTRGLSNAGALPTKGIGMIGRLGGSITGGNVPATAGLAGLVMASGHPLGALGVATTITQNPGAMASGARLAAKIAPKAINTVKTGGIDAVTSYLTNTLSTNPSKLGPYAQPLINAAQTGGSQGVAATHFLLSQQYPDYNKMMMEQEGSNETQSESR